MPLRYPYPQSPLDTRMDYLMPITSPNQPNNRILPTWGGAGSGMGCGCAMNEQQSTLSGLGSGMMIATRRQLALGDLQMVQDAAVRWSGVVVQVAPPYVWGLNAVLRAAFTAAGAYHGYARNGSVGSAIGYGALAAFLPTIGLVTMAVQGIAERK